MVKICVGVLTCPKHKSRFIKFMKMYENVFKQNNITYYIIQSDPGLNDEYKIVGNNFYCATKEAYEVLAHKLVIFYTYIYEKTDFDFVYKVDDGCLLNLDNIKKLPNHDYVGTLMVPTINTCHFGKCSDHNLNHVALNLNHKFDTLSDIDHEKIKNIKKIRYCGGGYGYGLSRNALCSILKYKHHVLSLQLSYEDVLFGQILYLENIKPTNYKIGDYHGI